MVNCSRALLEHTSYCSENQRRCFLASASAYCSRLRSGYNLGIRDISFLPRCFSVGTVADWSTWIPTATIHDYQAIKSATLNKQPWPACSRQTSPGLEDEQKLWAFSK